MPKQKVTQEFVGNRRIWYADVKIIKDNIIFSSCAEFKTKKEALAGIRKAVQKSHGNKKYKVLQLFRLPAEMEIEVLG